jgi:hypothetical protein
VVEERVTPYSGDRSYVAVTDWSHWNRVYAADNAWSYLMTDTVTGETMDTDSWSFIADGGLATRFVQNEVWFYDNAGWQYGGTYLSIPGPTSGAVNGAGYCSS